MKLLRSLHEWMFGYGSPVAIGVFRMVFGTLAFVNFAMVAIDFEAWYTERGFVPVGLLERWTGGIPRLNLLEHVTNDNVTAVFVVDTSTGNTAQVSEGLFGTWSPV